MFVYFREIPIEVPTIIAKEIPAQYDDVGVVAAEEVFFKYVHLFIQIRLIPHTYFYYSALSIICTDIFLVNL